MPGAILHGGVVEAVQTLVDGLIVDNVADGILHIVRNIAVRGVLPFSQDLRNGHAVVLAGVSDSLSCSLLAERRLAAGNCHDSSFHCRTLIVREHPRGDFTLGHNGPFLDVGGLAAGECDGHRRDGEHDGNNEGDDAIALCHRVCGSHAAFNACLDGLVALVGREVLGDRDSDALFHFEILLVFDLPVLGLRARIPNTDD